MNRRNFIKNSTTAAAGLCLAPTTQVLAANSSTYHKVTAGETLTAIGSAYGVKVQDLQKANSMTGVGIKEGQRLFIPHYNTGYKPPLPTLPAKPGFSLATQKPMRDWKYLVVHHSGTKQGSAGAFDDYHRRKRRMSNGLAYHFVIGNGTGSSDGEIEVGNRWKQQIHGGHVRSDWHNTVGVGICLVGNFEKQRPTTRQMESFNMLVDYLHNNLLRNKVTLVGHRELNTEQTLCPGRYFPMSAVHQRYS